MFCLHIHTSFYCMRSLHLYIYAYRSSYGATHIHYLFPDFIHFYFVHIQKKHTHAHARTANSDCQIYKHVSVNAGVCTMKIISVSHTIFICFEWWKWTFIGWNWMSWHFHIWIDTIHVSNVCLCTQFTHTHNAAFVYVYCYFQFLMG